MEYSPGNLSKKYLAKSFGSAWMYNFYNIGLNYTNEVQYEVQLKSIIKAGQQTVEG